MTRCRKLILAVAMIALGFLSHFLAPKEKPNTNVQALTPAAAERLAGTRTERRRPYEIVPNIRNPERTASLEDLLGSRDFKGIAAYLAVRPNLFVDERQGDSMLMSLAGAAEKGNSDAMIALGILSKYGIVVFKDVSSAESWYRRAIAIGNPNGYIEIAKLYLDGRAVVPDFDKAEEGIRLAMDAGLAVGFRLGGLLDLSRGDIVGAIEKLKHAATGGDAEAASTLSQLYERSAAGSAGSVEVEKWRKLALELGDARSNFEEGKHEFESGIRGADNARAADGLTKIFDSANRGNASAALEAASILMASTHRASEDIEEARRFATQAYEAGAVGAAFMLASLEGSAQAARKWLEIGRLEKDWRSDYALRLADHGTPMLDALKIVSASTVNDFYERKASVLEKPSSIRAAPPVAVKTTKPTIPIDVSALGGHAEATVEAIIDTAGNPTSLQVTKSTHPSLDEAVLVALSQWKFKPATEAGRPVPFKLRIPFVFNSPAK